MRFALDHALAYGFQLDPLKHDETLRNELDKLFALTEATGVTGKWFIES